MKYIKTVITFVLVLSLLISTFTLKPISSVQGANGVLTSEDIKVQGFQIKTNDPENSVNFRAICKAPNKGSKLVINEQEYVIEEVGTIYTLDSDCSGDAGNSILDETYTYIEAVEGKRWQYEGIKMYNNENVTYGFCATEAGIDENKSDSENVYYVMTVQGMEEYIENTLHVRAFVSAIDKNGDKVIIYGSDVAHMSIPEVAEYFYVNSMASNYQGHKYLYEKILNAISESNPYYKNYMYDYGWNDNLYTPEWPTVEYVE